MKKLSQFIVLTTFDNYGIMLNTFNSAIIKLRKDQVKHALVNDFVFFNQNEIDCLTDNGFLSKRKRMIYQI